MSNAEALVSPSVLRELLSLNPETGRLTWRKREPRHFTDGRHSADHQCANWNARFEGKEAFYSVDTQGYRHGYIFNRIFSAARVVFALVHGSWPAHHIDHINGVKTDDRPANLRDVTQQENMRNRALSSNSSTGVHGVSKHLGKYEAYIQVDKKRKRLGRFDQLADAVKARQAAELEHGYHPNHGRNCNAHYS